VKLTSKHKGYKYPDRVRITLTESELDRIVDAFCWCQEYWKDREPKNLKDFSDMRRKIYKAKQRIAINKVWG